MHTGMFNIHLYIFLDVYVIHIYVTHVPAYIIYVYFCFVLPSFCVVVVGGTAARVPAHRPVPATNGLLPPANR